MPKFDYFEWLEINREIDRLMRSGFNDTQILIKLKETLKKEISDTTLWRHKKSLNKKALRKIEREWVDEKISYISILKDDLLNARNFYTSIKKNDMNTIRDRMEAQDRLIDIQNALVKLLCGDVQGAIDARDSRERSERDAQDIKRDEPIVEIAFPKSDRKEDDSNSGESNVVL